MLWAAKTGYWGGSPSSEGTWTAEIQASRVQKGSQKGQGAPKLTAVGPLQVPPATYLQVTVLDGAAGRQAHGSLQQAVGDRGAVLQEPGLLQGDTGTPGAGHAAGSNAPESVPEGETGLEGPTSAWEWAVLQKRRWLAEPGRSVRLRMWSLAEAVR